ncbi:MAG TPA: hypothetical protein VG838_05270 [Opitutaceae bacterium]|nr:hypothetical protein [Opitutaceae bacterium]
MKYRSALGLAAVSLVGLAIFRHWTTGTRMAQLAEEKRRESRQLQLRDEEAAGLLARIASDHARLRTAMSAPVAQTRQPVKIAPAPTAAAGAAGNARNARIAGDPRLREMDVKVYVDGQKLKFGAALARLGLTPEQRQKFDDIQAEYEEHFLDMAADAEERHLAVSDPVLTSQRRQLSLTQEAECQALFGPAYGQWKEETSAPPERGLVAQIAQKALSGAGALAESQVGPLTDIVVANKRPGVSSSLAAGYDWDAIVGQATVALSPEQAESFKTAIELVLAESQMSAMAKAAGN